MVLLLSPLHIAASKDIIPPEAFYKKNVLKNFANFRGKHMCWSLFLIRLGLKGVNLSKMRLKPWCIPVKFAKFSSKLILKNIYKRLLLCLNAVNYFRKKTSFYMYQWILNMPVL